MLAFDPLKRILGIMSEQKPEELQTSLDFEEYPEGILKAIGYIATHLSNARREHQIALTMPPGHQRELGKKHAERDFTLAQGASDILGMIQEPPRGENWIEAMGRR